MFHNADFEQRNAERSIEPAPAEPLRGVAVAPFCGRKAVCEAAVLPASPNDEVAQGRGRQATLRASRSRYSIHGKVRALRLEKTMGLVELWQHTRLSRALLSKDRAWTPVPDAANVLHIALAFSVGLESLLSAHSTRRSLSWCRRTGGCSYPIALARARARIDSNPLTVRRPSGVSTRIGCEKARKNTRGSLIGLRLRRAGFRTSRLVTSVTPQCSEFHGRSLQTPTTGMLGTPASR